MGRWGEGETGTPKNNVKIGKCGNVKIAQSPERSRRGNKKMENRSLSEAEGRTEMQTV